MIVLPRQAQDKHRESTSKRRAVYAGYYVLYDAHNQYWLGNYSLATDRNAPLGVSSQTFVPVTPPQQLDSPGTHASKGFWGADNAFSEEPCLD